MQNLLNLINTDSEPKQNHTQSSILLSLKDLFDFEVEYWQNSSNAAGTCGLLDELEFYELLDLDTLGEQDTYITIDNMSEAVLMSH